MRTARCARDSFSSRLALSSRLLLPCLLLGLVACVPYQTYREVETELGRTLQVNRDLEKQMKEAEARMAKEGAQDSLTAVSYSQLREDYDAILARNSSLEQANAALMKRINEMPDFPVGGPDQGFTQDQAAQVGAELGEQGNLILDAGLLFGPGKSILKGGTKQQLAQLAQIIKSNHSGRIVHIHGHTDATPITKSKNKDNWELAFKRAHAVFEFLVAQGLTKESMRLHSAGFAVPADGVDDPKSKDGMARCRRVEVWLQ